VGSVPAYITLSTWWQSKVGNLQESRTVYHLPLFMKPHARISVRDRRVDRHFVVPETQTSESATTEWNVGRRGEGGEASRRSILLLTPLKRKFIPPSTSRIYLIMHHYYYCHHHHQPPHDSSPYHPLFLLYSSRALHPTLLLPSHLHSISASLAGTHPLRIAHHFTQYTHVLFHLGPGGA